MWWFKRLLFSLIAAIALVAIPTMANAQASLPSSSEVRRAVIISTAVEAVLATTALIKDRNDEPFEKGGWSIKFSDRNWVLTGEGRRREGDFTYTISGFLWGDDKDDWLVSYSGTGINGKEPIYINGTATWRSDHSAMDFRNVVKFGENSVWGWVVGSEVIFGGVIGAGGAVIAVTVSTAGLGVPAALVIGGAGAIGGASALVSLSQTAKDIVNSDEPVPSPPLPKMPPAPEKGEVMLPAKDRIFVAVSKDGRILGSGPDGAVASSGSFERNTGTGILFAR
jgi:hypothetical protein